MFFEAWRVGWNFGDLEGRCEYLLATMQLCCTDLSRWAWESGIGRGLSVEMMGIGFSYFETPRSGHVSDCGGSLLQHEDRKGKNGE